jgi:hypothetical protein
MIGKYLPALALVVSLGALASAAVVYNESQNTYRRLSGDIAQVKVSLTLLTRRAGAGGEGQEIVDLQNRLAILEDSWRRNSSPQAPVAAEAPAFNPPVAATTTAPADGPTQDCIPPGTAFVMTGADAYPICGTRLVIAFASIDTDAAVLDNGLALAKGLSSPLPESDCSATLLSSDASIGFAELRVTC